MEKYILGIDIGGSKIQAGLVNYKNQIIKSQKTPIRQANKKQVLNSIINSIDKIFLPAVKSIGLGITGLVNSKKGVSIQSPNLPRSWHNVNLKKILEKKYNRQVFLDNDANCIALAEAVAGLGKNYQYVLSLTIGTGIGAGLVINKKIYRGWQGAIEYGHTVISDSKIRCSCLRIGHLESLASGKGLEKIYFQASGRQKNTYQIINQAKKDYKKTLALQKMSKALSIGLANAIHSYNPEIIILGGGLAKIEQIVQPALKQLPKRLIFPELKKTKIVTSRLGYQAGVIGAALITKQ